MITNQKDLEMIKKWRWMADWCKTNGLSPYNEAIWDLAKQKWEQIHNNKKGKIYEKI